jgi:hypothetical protein
MPVGYLPDLFGHVGQMPQIWRQFGFDNTILWRGFGGASAEYWWDAPDGSMERTCERALELRLRSVAFTDHADFTAATLLSDPARLPAPFRRWVRDGMLAPPPMPLEGYRSACSAAATLSDLKILSGSS